MNPARRVRRAAIAAGLVTSTTVVAVPATYLTVITIAGLLPRRRPPTSSQQASTRFAILVPAHDEASVIEEALCAFDDLDYPSELFWVHVVADNCTDDTALLVRKSRWSVHERNDPNRPGKGPALNWLIDRLECDGAQFDAVVIVDADTSVDRRFLRAMDAAYRDGSVSAQGYYSVREPQPSPATSFRFAALACRHRLRPIGRCRIGGSSGLYGNGMMFERSLLTERRWSGHLVEDAEFQNELLLDGHRVDYVADAVLWAEMPHSNDQAASQNERWERGRIEVARHYVPRLISSARTSRGNRIAHCDAVLDHLVPPLSVLVALQIVVGASTAIGTVRRHRPSTIALCVNLAALGAVVAHTIAGLVSARASVRHYRALLSAPTQIVWKTGLWVSVLTGRRDVGWTRTRRNAAPTDAARGDSP